MRACRNRKGLLMLRANGVSTNPHIWPVMQAYPAVPRPLVTFRDKWRGFFGAMWH